MLGPSLPQRINSQRVVNPSVSRTVSIPPVNRRSKMLASQKCRFEIDVSAAFGVTVVSAALAQFTIWMDQVYKREEKWAARMYKELQAAQEYKDPYTWRDYVRSKGYEVGEEFE